MASLPSRLFVTAVAAASMLLGAVPAEAASRNYRIDWDIQWLKQTNGGFADDYFYDPTMFYYTLPSRAKSFALHSYHRQNYYKTFHAYPPSSDYQPEPSPQQLATCNNYTFSRPDRVPPFGYECQR